MMIRDFRLALRQLRKSPGFTVTAIITLTLGIGANAIVFSVLNAVMLRPVNVPDAQNLIQVQRNFQRFRSPAQSYLNYLDLRDRNRTFESLAAYLTMGAVGVDTGGNPSTAWPCLASGNYFDALGIQPYLGRFFHASDEKGYDSAPYVVLSYAYWNSHFHQDTGVVGRRVDINKHPFTIIGVAPPEFRGTELFFAPALWIPLVEQPTVMGANDLQYRSANMSWVIGRLKPGIAQAQAAEDLNAMGAWLAKTYPVDDDGIKFSLAQPGLGGDMVGGAARAFMAGLMLLAGLILLAACANLGSLFAARAADRAKEVALRLALGSRRMTILRQLLTEAVLVSIAGGAIGLVGGVFVLHALTAWNPFSDIPIIVPVNPDPRTYAVAFLLALLSGLLFGIMPVGQVLRADPWQVIRTGSAGAGGMKRFMLRDLLLAIQIAICALLVTSSLVAVRGLMRSLQSNYGFSPQNVTLVSTNVHMAGYSDNDAAQMERRMIDAAGAIPGVKAAGYISQVPLNLGAGDSTVFSDATTDYRPTNSVADAMDYNISPGYLEAVGTKLLAGRDLRFDDDKKASTVALVNRQFAVKVFGSVEKAVGGHFKFWSGNRAEVVGVVEDGKYRTLTEDQQPAMFFSFEQHDEASTWLVVRSQRDPEEMAQALERTLHGLDSGLPLDIRPWTQHLDAA
jgi:predicted permease